MEGQVQRRENWNDCVVITKLVCDRNGGGLQREILTSFDDTDRESPVFEATIASLRRLVAHLYNVDHFPDANDDDDDDDNDDDDEDSEDE